MTRACVTPYRPPCGEARSAAACRFACAAIGPRTRWCGDIFKAPWSPLRGPARRPLAAVAWPQHDVGPDDLAALPGGRPHHAAFGHRRMLEQRRLHFRTRDVVARRDDHVVGARLVPEIAVGIHEVGVAGDIP